VGEREKLLAAVQARFERVAVHQDPSLVLEPDAITEARRLSEIVADHDEDLQARSLLGWLHWYRYLALPEGEDGEDLQAAIELLLPCFLSAAGQLPGPLLPRLAEEAFATATELLRQALDSADLDLLAFVVDLHQRMLDATPADHPGRALFLSNLAIALTTRFERTGALADLDAAIQNLRAAVDTAADDAHRARWMSNLGIGLRVRFERTGAQADLDAAIEVGRAAVDATPADDPDRAGAMNNLGYALRLEFERTGALADLDTAIENHREAVEATAADHPERHGRLNNLGIALATRFERTGALTDLDAAILIYREAVDVIPAGHPSRARWMSNLGNALTTRFERTGVQADLDEAIRNHREAVDAIPAAFPDRAAALSNLGNALRAQVERTGTLADLDEAIRIHREAVEATPADHPDRAGRLNNLGNALGERFERTGAQADLDEAIRIHREAVEATPADHPDQSMYLLNAASALRSRFERTRAQADLEVALSAFARAAGVGSAAPSVRISAARAAAGLAAPSDPARAADLLETAVLLLPEVAPRQLERGDQQYAIGRFAGLAEDAAALSLADPAGTSRQRAERALRLLEAGRAVLLSQALDTRSDLTDLRAYRPDLAARFADLRAQFDRALTTDALTLNSASGTDAAARRERRAEGRRILADDLNATLAQIRAQAGFASFALLPATEELLAQAVPGPVVLFNISRYRSDALLVSSDAVAALELPVLTRDALIDQINAFYQAMDAAHNPGPGADRAGAQATIREILAWLWDAAAEPVLAALGYTGGLGPDVPWPRVWWAAGGLLGLLPLHAAGHHSRRPDAQQRTVMDRVVSSYTPTIRALRYARQHASRPAAAQHKPTGHALIVAMPSTPGFGRLPNVPAETAMLRTRLPRPVVLTESIDDSAVTEHTPTRANVLGQLPGCAIAHFACHGISDSTDPSQSQLVLQDYHDAPFTVASLAPVDLDQAQLAYLSACNTTLSRATELLDEGIHLTGAFQLAGFPHVIGTLWAISDQLAVEIASAFYADLSTSAGGLDTSHAARALNNAMRSARDTYPITPSLWAAYLHAGT
jgi:tetratricopeptide (TPR) repeat protein